MENKLIPKDWVVFPTDKQKRSLGKWKDEGVFAGNIDFPNKYFQHSMLGVDCGKTGIVVIDVDMHGGVNGVDSFKALYTALGLDPIKTLHDEYVVTTPSGGFHIYYLARKPYNVRNKAGIYYKGTKYAGIDVRGTGGYVIIPPSYNDVGKYEVINSDVNNMSVLPEVLAKALITPQKKISTINSSKKKRSGSGDIWKDIKEELLIADEGERNDTLNKIIYSKLSGYYIAGSISEENVFEEVLPICDVIGLSRDESIATIRSALHAGNNDELVDIYKKIVDVPTGTLSLARYLRDKLADKVVPIQEYSGGPLWGIHKVVGKSSYWDIVRSPDAPKEVINEVLSNIVEYSKKIPHTKSTKELHKKIDILENKPLKHLTYRLSATNPVNKDKFDTAVKLLNTPSGVLNIVKKKFISRGEQKKYKFTKITKSNYRPELIGTEPYNWLLDFLKSLTTDMGYNQLRVWVGRSLLTHSGMEQKYTGQEVLAFIYGPTASGKTTFLKALMQALGGPKDPGGYIVELDPSAIGKRKETGMRPELINLEGAKLILIDEGSDRHTIDSTFIKRISAGHIETRGLYKPTTTYNVTGKIIYVTNEFPNMDTWDTALRRRVDYISFPFERSNYTERSATFIDRIQYDPDIGDAMLTWAVECASEIYTGVIDADKYLHSDEARKLANEHAIGGSPIASWADTCLTINKEATEPITTKELFQSFLEWYRDYGKGFGFKPITTINFFGTLLKNYITSLDSDVVKKVRVGDKRGFAGIELKTNIVTADWLIAKNNR